MAAVEPYTAHHADVMLSVRADGYPSARGHVLHPFDLDVAVDVVQLSISLRSNLLRDILAGSSDCVELFSGTVAEK